MWCSELSERILPIIVRVLRLHPSESCGNFIELKILVTRNYVMIHRGIVNS